MKILAQTKSSDSQPDLPTGPDFPSVRYFQIHFDHLHETIEGLRRQVDQANQQIAELQQQLQVKSALLAGNSGTCTAGDEVTPDSG